MKRPSLWILSVLLVAAGLVGITVAAMAAPPEPGHLPSAAIRRLPNAPGLNWAPPVQQIQPGEKPAPLGDLVIRMPAAFHPTEQDAQTLPVNPSLQVNSNLD